MAVDEQKADVTERSTPCGQSPDQHRAIASEKQWKSALMPGRTYRVVDAGNHGDERVLGKQARGWAPLGRRKREIHIACIVDEVPISQPIDESSSAKDLWRARNPMVGTG